MAEVAPEQRSHWGQIRKRSAEAFPPVDEHLRLQTTKRKPHAIYFNYGLKINKFGLLLNKLSEFEQENQ